MMHTSERLLSKSIVAVYFVSFHKQCDTSIGCVLLIKNQVKNIDPILREDEK